MDNLKTTIKEQLLSLPPEVLDVVLKKAWRQKAFDIAVQQELDEDQAQALMLEISLVLVGLEPLKNFRSNLMSQLEITYDKALKIAFDVNSQIFGGLMSHLKQFEQNIETLEKAEIEEKKSGQNSSVQTDTSIKPDHMIPSHDMMPGLHVHSQNVMPNMSSTAQSTSPTSVPIQKKFAPTVAPPQNLSTPSSTPERFGSIVDQKLSKLVRTERGETTIRDDVEERRKAVYKDADPYREPAN